MKTSHEYRHFLVEEGSEAHRVIRCWQEQMADHRYHIEALKIRHGIADVWETNSAFSGVFVTGVSISGEVPQGWRHLKKHPEGMLTPVLGGKGAEARRLLKAMQPPSRKVVHQGIGYTEGCTISGNMVVRSAGFNVMSGRIVVHVPRDSKNYTPPPGLNELKMSELYALVEEEEVAA